MSPNNPTICQFRIHNLKPPSLVQLLPSKRQPTSPKSGCSSSFWTAAIRRKPIPGSCSFGAFYGLPASASRKTRTDPSRTSSRKSRQSDSSTDEGGVWTRADKRTRFPKWTTEIGKPQLGIIDESVLSIGTGFEMYQGAIVETLLLKGAPMDRWEALE